MSVQAQYLQFFVGLADHARERQTYLRKESDLEWARGLLVKGALVKLENCLIY